MKKQTSPIGFMDSGLGGISVLREAVKLLPYENYIYYGDSANAPYGVKSAQEIFRLTERVVDILVKKDVKAIVLACNTATSVAVLQLRKKYNNIPIIGIEPALKPAALRHQGEKILVMATPSTLSEKKFHLLSREYGHEAEVVTLSCDGLMEYVEQGITEGEELDAYLKEKFKPYKQMDFGAIVLGCTHYPFLKTAIEKAWGKKTEILDGSYGTARQLYHRLQETSLLSPSMEEGSVEMMNSSGDAKMLMYAFTLLDLE